MKLLRDTWLIFAHSVRITLRNPVWVIVSLVQPIYFLVLFAPLLKSIANVPGFPPGGAMNVFTPGLLVQLGLFSTAFVGFGLIAELRSGLIERLRVTPVSRLSLLLGKALRDNAILMIQSVALMLLAIPFGLKIDLAGALITLGLLFLIGLVFTSCSYALAIILKSEDAMAPLANTVTMPLLLLSGILLPMSLAPGWLRAVSKVNPLTYAVDASRDLFNGHAFDADVAQGVIIFVALAALALWWAARTFRHATA